MTTLSEIINHHHEETLHSSNLQITLTNWNGTIPIENLPIHLIPNLNRNLARNNEQFSDPRNINQCSDSRNEISKRNGRHTAASSIGTLSGAASSSVLNDSTMEIVVSTYVYKEYI